MALPPWGGSAPLFAIAVSRATQAHEQSSSMHHPPNSLGAIAKFPDLEGNQFVLSTK
jgi:hypothetical protein